MTKPFPNTFDATFSRPFRPPIVDDPTLPPIFKPDPTPTPYLIPVQGAGLGFSSDALGVPLLPEPLGQQWDTCATWLGLPLFVTGKLPPFVLTVPKPTVLTGSPYCSPVGTLLNAVTGKVVDTVWLKPLLKRMVDATQTTLYVLSTGGPLQRANVQTEQPVTGSYVTYTGPVRLKYGPVVSAPFEYIAAGTCYTEIRLANTEPIGNLLYTNFGFEQVFGVVGTLEGPVFERKITDEETGAGTLAVVYRLTLQGAGESVTHALALAYQHTLVEVRQIGAAGQVVKVAQALPKRADADATLSGDRFDIVLTLPVSEDRFGLHGCEVAPVGLKVIECAEIN